MSLLPTPIPHPLTWLDPPDWTKTALEWVVGVDWPTGDEAALRDLADEWYVASRELGPLLADADQTVLEAVAAFGGPDGQVAAAILALWSQLGHGQDAALAVVADLLDDLGALVDAGANEIEGVKIEFYIELGLLLIELIALIATAFVTFGGSMAAAAPAMMATRFAIQQVLRKAAKELVERAVKKGIKDKIKDAIKDKVQSRLGRFALHAADEGLEEGLQELATSAATQAYQVSEGNRTGFDGRDLAMSFGLGTLGGAVASVSTLGGHRANSSFGHFGEHALRGAGGEILAEVSIGLVTGQGISWQSLGMAASSGGFGSVVSDTHHLATAGLADVEARLSETSIGSMGTATVDVTTSAGVSAALHSTTTLEPTGSPTVDSVSATSAHVLADATSPTSTPVADTTVPQSTQVATDTVAPSAPVVAEAVAPNSAPVVTEAVTPSGGGLSAVGTLAPGDLGAPVTGGPAPGPAAPAVAIPPDVVQPGAAASVGAPVAPAATMPTTVAPGAPGPPAPTGPLATDGRSRPADPGSAPPYDPEFLLLVRGAKPTTAGTKSAAPPPRPSFTPLLEDLQSERDSYADEVGIETRERIRAALHRLADRVSLRCQDRLDQLEWDTRAEHDRRAELVRTDPLLTPDDTLLVDLEHERILLRQRQRDLDQLRGLALTAADLDDEAVDELRRIGLGETADPRIRRAPSAVNDDDPRSQATGHRHPPPVEASRRYGQPGGYLPPLALHQQDVEIAVERDDDGKPRRLGDLFGDWLRRINDGGPQADPTRSINCVDVVLSVVDTWLHGRPRVAAPRTVDRVTLDDQLRPIGGEPGGALRIEEATGGRFQQLMGDHRDSDSADRSIAQRDGLRTLDEALLAHGHGAMAVLIREFPDGSAHATTVHHQHGQIVYVDAQRTDQPASTDRPGGAVRMDALLIAADGIPRDLGLPPGHWSELADSAAPDPEGIRAVSGPDVVPADMFRDATEAELRELGVGTANLADLGYAEWDELSLKDQLKLRTALPRTTLLDPYDLLFTQRSVSPATQDKITAVALETTLELDGWRGGPVHAVRWGDGRLASLDHRRLRAAQRAGLEAVPVAVHQPSDLLSDWPHEFEDGEIEKLALAADIRELPDRSWVAGGDEGIVVYRKGTVPRTWGEYALFRAAEQRSFLPGQLFGTHREPMLLPKPPELSAPVLDDVEAVALHELIEQAEAAADGVQRELERVGQLVAEELGVVESVRLHGTEHRIKSYESLARKFVDESRYFNRNLTTFRNVYGNDVLRFSLVLPDGPHYTPALDRVLAGLQEQGYELAPGSVKNFWQEGNRYYGVNATLRSPSGQLFEVQFPTATSLRVGAQTHDLYEVVRRNDERPARRVHALLQMLVTNKQLGIAGAIPPGLADRHKPKSGGLVKWITGNDEAWADYLAWLDYHGRDFADVVAEFGLTPDDFPAPQDPERDKDGQQPEAVLLRALRPGRGLETGRAGGRDLHHRDRGHPRGVRIPRPGVGSPKEGLVLRPGGGRPGEEQRQLPGPDHADRPADRRGDHSGNHRRRAAAGRGHDPLGVLVAGQPATAGLTPQSWKRVAHLLPRDDSGYQVQPRDGDYNGILPDAILDWAARIAPLGMSPRDFRSFVESLADALADSGLTPDQVDARLQGSSAHFFSAQHKSLPIETKHPEATAQFDVWFASDPNRPLRRPFDATYRLGLEIVPSDYDVQLSSDAMIERVELIQKLFFPEQKELYTRYDFVKHSLFEMSFPPVYRWSKLEQRRLNREVAPALFKGSGPPDKSPEVSSHFRDTDWRLDFVQDDTDAQAAQRLAVALTLREVVAAVQSLPQAVSSQTLIHELRKRPDLVELLLDSPDQRHSLLADLVAVIAEEGR